MSETRKTFAEVKALLGEEACQAAMDLAATAPPLSPQQEAVLAVLLRRDRHVVDLDVA